MTIICRLMLAYVPVHCNGTGIYIQYHMIKLRKIHVVAINSSALYDSCVC